MGDRRQVDPRLDRQRPLEGGGDPVDALQRVLAATPGPGRTGDTTVMTSRMESKTTITRGRTRIASGTPSGSGFGSGSRSMVRTMS